MQTSTWVGCYDDSWRGIITSESYIHPAKMARGLLARILSALSTHYHLSSGSCILDPCGGIATTGILGASAGYRVISVELEPAFVKLGNDNLQLHMRKWVAFGDPLPAHVQGDSRELRRVLEREFQGEFPCHVESGKVSSRVLDHFSGCERADSEQVESHKSASSVELRCPIRHGVVLEGNPPIVHESGTFWRSASQILGECYAVLRPGGLAVWIVQHFVRKGQLVDFPGGWRRMCERAGFETLEEVHASLVKEDRQAGLFGKDVVKRTERKSFFRRLAERKGSPAIDYEVVYFMRKVGKMGSLMRHGVAFEDADYGYSLGQLGSMRPGDVEAILASPPYPGSLHHANGIDYGKQVATTGRKPSVGRSALGGAYGDAAGQLGAMVEGEGP